MFRSRHSRALAVLVLGLALLWLLVPRRGPVTEHVDDTDVSNPFGRASESGRKKKRKRVRAARDLADDGPLRVEPRPFRGKELVLRNGLRVILVEDHSAPTIAAHVVVRFGAADEDPAFAGGAHMLEHMLFKGTDRIGTVDWRQEQPLRAELGLLYDDLHVVPPEQWKDVLADIRDLTGRADRFLLPNEVHRGWTQLGATTINATTSMEYTDYFVVLPSNLLEPWAALQSEMLANPVFRSFGTEREVVRDEFFLRNGHRESTVSQRVRRQLFGDHPYANRIGGTRSSLGRLTPSLLGELVDTWYVGENMAVVLVGDFDTVDAFETVKRYFGGLPSAGGAVVREPMAAPVHRGGGTVTGSRPQEISVSWSLVDLRPEEHTPLQVALSMLASELDAETGIYKVCGSLERFERGGIARLSFSCVHEPSCRRHVGVAVANLLADEPSASRVRSVARFHEVALLERFESHQEQALEIVRSWARGESLDDAWQRVFELHNVRPDDVYAAATRHLQRSPVIAVPGPDADAVTTYYDGIRTSAQRSGESAFLRSVLDMPVPRLPAQWREEGRDYLFDSDGRVVVVPNPANGLFAVDLTWDIGFDEAPLLCFALERWRWSANEASAGDWDAKFREHAVRMYVVCDAFETTVTLKGLGSGFFESLGHLQANLREPVIGRPPDKLYELMLNLATTPQSGAGAAYALYGAASPYLRSYPTRDELAAASMADLELEVSRLSTLEPRVAYTGQVDPDTLAAVTRGGGRPLDTRPPPVPVNEHRLVLIDRPQRRVSVRVIRDSEPYDPARAGWYALQDAMWEGSAGAAFERLREEGGRTYSVRGGYERGLAPGQRNRLKVTTSVRPHEAKATAIDLFRILVDRDLAARRQQHVLATSEERAWSTHRTFRQLPRLVETWEGRGVADPNPSAYRVASTVETEDYLAWFRAEAARPLTLIVEGPVGGLTFSELPIANVQRLRQSDVQR